MSKRNIQSSDLPSSVKNSVLLNFPVAAPSGDSTGSTDTAAILAQINAATAAGGGVVGLQAGTYIINGGALSDSTATLTISGVTKNVTIVRASTAATGDIITLGQPYSSITDLTINGKLPKRCSR
jgi:hypothetical protein